MEGRKAGVEALILACSLAGALATGVVGFFSIAAPWLVLPVALLHFWLFAHCRRTIVLLVAIGWLLYLPYEYGMKLRILCSGECNIRVDLLLIEPLLVLASLISFTVYLRARFANSSQMAANERK